LFCCVKSGVQSLTQLQVYPSYSGSKHTGRGASLLVSTQSESEPVGVLRMTEANPLHDETDFQMEKKTVKNSAVTSTPADASNTATAPSRTRSARSTSRVKSTCPAVTQTSQWLLLLISTGMVHTLTECFYLGCL